MDTAVPERIGHLVAAAVGVWEVHVVPNDVDFEAVEVPSRLRVVLAGGCFWSEATQPQCASADGAETRYRSLWALIGKVASCCKHRTVRDRQDAPPRATRKIAADAR